MKLLNKDIFYPKLITSMQGYKKEQLRKDIISGIIVAIVALPLAIAFGIGSGVTPEQGIITSIVAGFVVALLGGSRVQITGATGAMMLTVSGVVNSNYGMLGLLVATIMAGIILIIMGLLKLGDIIKFMPYPITVGFTAGIALQIFSLQINDFFGLGISNVPQKIYEQWYVYAQNFNHINIWALAIAAFTVVIGFTWAKFNKKIPGTLIAIIITTCFVQLLDIPVSTIGSRFGEINATLPNPNIPVFSMEMINDLLPDAFTIAMLGAIVTLLSAMVSDGAIGSTHRSNTELIAQGVGNMISPLFGGIPATGAIARTMTNVNNGGRTPVAGMVHAIVLLFILLFFGKWTKLIPMSCMAGILVVISYNMSDWRTFAGIFKSTRSEMYVLIVTFLFTIIFKLHIAIVTGILLAIFMFVRRVSQTIGIQVMQNEICPGDNEREILTEEALKIPEGVDVFEIDGPFFFGIASKFEEAQKQVKKKPKVRIIRMRKVPFMDTTGLKNLKSFYMKCKSDRIHIILSGVNEEVITALKTSDLYDLIGKENIFNHINPAMYRAEEIVSSTNKIK